MKKITYKSLEVHGLNIAYREAGNTNNSKNQRLYFESWEREVIKQ